LLSGISPSNLFSPGTDQKIGENNQIPGCSGIKLPNPTPDCGGIKNPNPTPGCGDINVPNPTPSCGGIKNPVSNPILPQPETNSFIDALNSGDLGGKGNILYASHSKGARGSTEGKHQKGETRKQKDQGGEKGDARRTPNPNKKR